jgi:hypothetical protein
MVSIRKRSRGPQWRFAAVSSLNERENYCLRRDVNGRAVTTFGFSPKTRLRS